MDELHIVTLIKLEALKTEVLGMVADGGFADHDFKMMAEEMRLLLIPIEERANKNKEAAAVLRQQLDSLQKAFPKGWDDAIHKMKI